MMHKAYAILFMTVIMGGCAATPQKPIVPISELRGDAKTAVIVQYGKEPLNYALGVVDGKSFWAEAAAGGLVGSAAQAMVDAEREKVASTVRQAMNGYDYAGEIAKGLMPAVAEKWGVQPASLTPFIKDAKEPLYDQGGNYQGTAFDSDLILAVSVNNVVLEEWIKLNIASVVFYPLARGLTLGAGDRNVAPRTEVGITVFKRDTASNKMTPVWRLNCPVMNAFMPVGYTIPEMTESPEKSREVFSGATKTVVEKCKELLARQI